MANIDHLKRNHIHLFAAATVFLLHLVLAAVHSIVSLCSELQSGRFSPAWVDKLKPLFDAYTGLYHGQVPLLDWIPTTGSQHSLLSLWIQCTW